MVTPCLLQGFSYNYYEDLTPQKVVEILGDLRAGKSPKVHCPAPCAMWLPFESLQPPLLLCSLKAALAAGLANAGHVRCCACMSNLDADSEEPSAAFRVGTER